MYYVYLLKSESADKYYLGYTANLRQRFYHHNQGRNSATKSGTPWRLVYYEAYTTKAAALSREKKLKHHGKGLSEIKRRVEAFVEP